MANLMGWGLIAATFLPYGNLWRAQRRLYQHGFNADAVRELSYPILTEKINGFLHNLLTTPDDFVHHTEMMLGAVIFKFVYGRDLDVNASSKDPIFEAAAQSVRNLIASILPGSFLVNTIPVLQRLPEWFPGCYFQRFARETLALTMEVFHGGYAQALQDMEGDSLVKKLEEYKSKNVDTDTEVAKGVCAVSYAAAADNTRTIMSTFFLLMREHPEVQRQAYEEIVYVCGMNKLPEFSDRAALPYVQAVYLEVMRWMPVLPLSLPHATSEDDVYRGYFIPKGSSVIGNMWTMLNDEEKYPNPRTFQPERFLAHDGKLMSNTDVKSILAYGFGRRVCPGRHFGDAVLWRAMACILAAFVIGKEQDGPPETMEQLEAGFDQGIMAFPPAFKCTIKPRTSEMADVIRSQTL